MIIQIRSSTRALVATLLLLPVLVLAQGTSPNQGLYFDPQVPNQGFGVGISERDDGPAALTFTWYTYTRTGTAIWYLGTDDLIDNRASVAMSQFSMAADGSLIAEVVGNIDVEFVTPDRALISFDLNGEAGAQSLERILPVDSDPTSPIQTGLWFPPATPGWGLNWLKEGASEAAILYIYDENGEPTWVITDAVTNGRADLLIFSGGSCPTCPPAAAEFERQGFLEREFVSTSEAVGTVDLVTADVVWQMTDASLTTLTTTVDPLTESLESALYGGDYATGGKPAEVMDAALAALLSGAAGPGGKGEACLTTTTNPASLGFPLPVSFGVTMSAEGECMLPNGEGFSGSLELDVQFFSLGATGFDVRANAIFNDFRRNGRLIADGTIAMTLDVGSTAVGSRFNGRATLDYDQVLTGSGLADGFVAAELTGLFVTPGPADQLLGGQIVNGYRFALEDFSLDGQALDGTINISHETTSSVRNSEISADLQTAQGTTNFTITVRSTRQEVNGENQLTLTLNTVGPAQFGPYQVAFDELLYAPEVCTYFPIAGEIAASGPGLDVVLMHDGSCGPGQP